MDKNRRVHLSSEQLEDRLVPSLDLTGVEFRTIDGTNNNIALPNQGAAETRQIRFGYGAQFPDGFGDAIITATTTPRSRPSPRTISNTIHAQSGSLLSARRLTDWAFQWGQFVTHDMDLTRNGPEFNRLSTGETGDFSIPVTDPNDPLGPNPIPFNRSQFDAGTGVPGARREVVNSITSYIDGSLVYGSDPVRAAALRTGQGGKLKTTANGLLPPLNTAGLPNANASGLPDDQLFLTGDVRANEQVNLTVVHTLFIREHNRLADRIAEKNPGLSDEQIYQVARRIVGAEMQIITYEEYLPAVLGSLAPNPDAAVYNPNTNATITNSFAHAAFRFGHSQISPATLLVNQQGQTVGTLSVRQAFFNPNFLKNNPGNVDLALKGLAFQIGQESDVLLVDEIRNSLFGPPGAGGLDLGALDIQRGRDHGLPDFNTLRRLYGVAPVTSFEEISSDPAIVAKLRQLYPDLPQPDGTVIRGFNNIDPFVGMLAEDHLPGTSIGPTINAIVGNQFERLRDGDRFFYTNDTFLQSDAVKQIFDVEKVTLAKIIKLNTGVVNMQDNIFFLPSPQLAATRPASEVVSAPLTAEQAEPLLDEARDRWQATGADASFLDSVEVQVADLPGTMLGQASDNSVWLDVNAAGWGWFLDATPWDDAEFTTPGDQGEQERMDLLTTMMHELGHVLGLEDLDPSAHAGELMAATLTAGTRRLPTTGEVKDSPAESNTTVTLTDTRTGQVLAVNEADNVSQLILVGSDSAADLFNLFIATANGGIEDGVLVHGRSSANDAMNVYGTTGDDTFAVGSQTVVVNGNTIHHSGLEKIRIITRGGNDDVQIDPDIAAIVEVLSSWDPLNG